MPILNPLRDSTAFFDLIHHRVSFVFKTPQPMPTYLTPQLKSTIEVSWKYLAGDIRRSLKKLGIPRGDVVMDGNPVVIAISDWGEVRLVNDEHGPRILVRACRPNLIGRSFSFGNGYDDRYLGAIMDTIANAQAFAQGHSSSAASTSRRTWKKKVFTTIQLFGHKHSKAWH